MKIKSAVTAAVIAASLQFVNAADITGTVTLKGTPPAEVPNAAVMDDPVCGKLHTTPPTTHHYVVGAKGELANVVVLLKDITGKSTGAAAAPALVDQKGCQYAPQIFAVQTGQKITVKNSDPVMHNIHTQPAAAGNGDGENKAQMSGGPDLSFSFPKEEKFLKFKCDVHPWMFAWVTVVDSPYFAVTDKDGNFTIKNVPAGKYTLTAFHRKAAPTGADQAVEVKADGAKADFTLEVPAAK
jgi:plastocyanin